MTADTIIAISTPSGYGGLGIVRLSGAEALPIARKIFVPRKKEKIQARRVVFGNLYHFERGDFFDEGYLTFFREPRSYTKEDLVEITCHGSPAILEEVVRLGVKAGARMALPGEFTLRAYLNGRVDILQAEAVNDLITAASFSGVRAAYRQMQGGLSRRMAGLRSQVIHLLARVEAGLEFPDEGIRISRQTIRKSLERLIESIWRLIKSYEMGRILREGLTLAIVGKANVGKSTLFNAFLNKDRAIVSPFPGTTRDYLQERIRVKDSLFSLVDMAGLGRPGHPVEAEGIKKGRKIAAMADGVLLLFDSSRKEGSEDLKILRKLKDKKAILLFNKADLPKKINKQRLRSLHPNSPFLEISALKGTNIERLKTLIHDFFIPSAKEEEDMILHLREKLALEEIVTCLETALNLLVEGFSEEICAEEIRKAVPHIGLVTGEIRADDVIEDIFSRFCVGK